MRLEIGKLISGTIGIIFKLIFELLLFFSETFFESMFFKPVLLSFGYQKLTIDVMIGKKYISLALFKAMT